MKCRLPKWLKLPPSPLKVLGNQSGMALLIALFVFMILTAIAIEVSYDTAVDYVVAAQAVNQVRARYAAKSGLELSLLRIKIYKQAMGAFGDQLGANASMLDLIWSFPMMWPPSVAGVEGVTGVEEGLIQSAVKESLMEGSYATTITPEGARIDLNDLASPAKALQKATRTQVLKIFTSALEQNEEFSDKYRGFNFEELVNNIADYVDDDAESLNGGDESSAYRDIEDSTVKLPPNRPLRTVDELHQVAGMKDDFYKLLEPRVTVFGTKMINVNYASKDVLMSLDPSMTEEAADKVIERRNNPKLGGPFGGLDDFIGFLRNYGVDSQRIQEDAGAILGFGTEFNFRIISTGLSANAKREITAITYDFENLTPRLGNLLYEQDRKEDDGRDKDKKPQPPKAKPAKGRPTVVSWEES